MKLGVDIGSVAAKVAVVNDSNDIVESKYRRTGGQPDRTIRDLLSEVFNQYPTELFTAAAATGTGARQLAASLGIPFVNEIIAQAAGTFRQHPDVKTIFEIGGADSKLILLGEKEAGVTPVVKDFTMSGACAAGTGSFLDQQAARLGISVSKLGDTALESSHPASVAGRCSVFAKTDMIHLQQVGTPLSDIVAGLCHAVVRQFKTNLIHGRDLLRPIAFQGGVAANQGIQRAFRDILGLAESELIVPEHHAVLGALGAVITAPSSELPADAIDRLQKYIDSREYHPNSLSRIMDDGYALVTEPVKREVSPDSRVYLGVDVGSISTNVVAIDAAGNVLARRYLMTAGKPIEAVTQGLRQIGDELGDGVIVQGAGSTGSGRQLTGAYLGADIVKNEVTSHALGATFMYPEVDTVFEIGGQDAKYISLNHGTIVDFAMNKVCAAGTGSFLEEQSGKLELDINREFADLAFASRSPLDLGERCTVFMESQLGFHQQNGAHKPDMVSGLAYSIVKNYITKVVESHRIGDHILFQGGVAYNRAVKAAFENVLGKTVTVPPHHDILGAIGVALLARDARENADGPSKFKGFDLQNRHYELSTFVCQDCNNHCEVNRAVFAGEPPLHYGSRCGKYDVSEVKQRKLDSKLPRLFEERHRKLVTSYPKDAPDAPNGKTVGIPRSLFFHELFPLWKAFFSELGFRVTISAPTSRKIIRQGVENVLEEPCLPIKVAFGHVLDLLESQPDYIFLPVQSTMEPLSPGFSNHWNCPITQAIPYILNSSAVTENALNQSGDARTELLRPVMHPDRGREHLTKTFRRLAREIGISDRARTDAAIEAGFTALDSFNDWLRERGREVLKMIGPEQPAVAIIGRTYTTCDPEMSLNLPDKLHDLGLLAVPLDMLPLTETAGEVARDHPNMYWKSGQKILSAARFIAEQPNLFALYVTNFNCGPDSFIMKYFGQEMQSKPYLTLELDEHSADAGIKTRCEALVDTIRGTAERRADAATDSPVAGIIPLNANSRCFNLPYMLDHGILWIAAAKYYGQDSNALPMCDDATLELGRKYTDGKECYPSIVILSDILKRALEANFDPARESFLVPSASGPCRFGQYNRLFRIALDQIGMEDVPVITLDQTSNWGQHLTHLGRGYRLRTWRASVLLDLIQKMQLERRPYEVNPGEIDRLYGELLADLTRQVEHERDGFQNFAARAKGELASVKIDRSVPKPRIGLIGEIFVRSNEFANNYLVRNLEKLGASCTLPPIQEWFNYTEYQRLRRSRLRIEGGLKDWLKQQLSASVQAYSAAKLGHVFDGAISDFAHEPPTGEVIRRGREYITPAVEGEAILSLGRAIEYAENGFDGIVNVIPFGCMPGTVVSMLMHRFSEDYGIPVHNLVVDGNKDLAQDIRLEAFYYQCQEHLRRKLATLG
jgi:predicted CoA-substrate-specific enzyme activase